MGVIFLITKDNNQTAASVSKLHDFQMSAIKLRWGFENEHVKECALVSSGSMSRVVLKNPPDYCTSEFWAQIWLA